MTMTILDVKLSELTIDEDLDFRTTGEDVSELAASIKEYGLMQPITVAPANGDGKYHVIAGRRRLRALQSLEHKTAPVIVREDMESTDAQVIGQIIENLHREDVSAIDEARSYAKLLDLDVLQKDIAKLVGVSAAHVSGRLALLKLPEAVVKKVLSGQVPTAVATKLARAPKAVRDEVADSHTIDERTIASAQRGYDERKGREKLADELAAAGVPAAASTDGWGYCSDDKKAKLIGLTDDDKPKTHSWDGNGTISSYSFDDHDSFVAAVVAANPKGAYVAGGTNNLQVHLITSANLDLEAKKDRERREAEIAERKAAQEAERKLLEDPLRAIIGAPDKASLISTVLQAELRRLLSLPQYPLSSLEWALLVYERLGLTAEVPDPQAPDHEVVQQVWQLVKEHASKSSQNMCAAILACSPVGEVTQGLVDQGIFEDLDPAEAHVDDQLEWFERGWVTRERLSAEAVKIVEEMEADEAAEQEAESEIASKVETALAEAIDEAEQERGEPLSEDEISAMRSTIEEAARTES